MPLLRVTAHRNTFAEVYIPESLFSLEHRLWPVGSLLIDGEKLSSRYVPPRLPYRDQQLALLKSFLGDLVRGEAASPRVALLIGPTGTGKTSSVLLLHKALAGEGWVHAFAHINMRIAGDTPFQLFAALYESVARVPASRSVSAYELLKETVTVLKREGLPALFVFDEVEFHARTALRSAIYALARLHELQAAQVAMLFIARNLDWLKLLDPAERSSLGNVVIRYPPYTRDQLLGILEYRAQEAFRAGAVGENVLSWLADYTYTYMQSDVRRALDTLLLAALIAEQEGASRVEIRHVVAALKQSEVFVAPAEVEQLTLYEKLTLYAVLRASEARPYARLSEVWEELLSLVEQLGLEPPAPEDFEDLVQRLVDLGALLAEGPARIAPAPTLNTEVVTSALKETLKTRVRTV